MNYISGLRGIYLVEMICHLCVICTSASRRQAIWKSGLCSKLHPNNDDGNEYRK